MFNSICTKITTQSKTQYTLASTARETLFNFVEDFTSSFDPLSVCRARLPREFGFDYCRFSASESMSSFVDELYRNSYRKPQDCLRAVTTGTVAYAMHLCVGLAALYDLAYNCEFDIDLVSSGSRDVSYDVGKLYSQWVFSQKYSTSWDNDLPAAHRCFHWCADWGLKKEYGGEPIWRLGRVKLCLERGYLAFTGNDVRKAIQYLCTCISECRWCCRRDILEGILSSLSDLVGNLADYLRNSMSLSEETTFGVVEDPIVNLRFMRSDLENTLAQLQIVD